MRRTLALVLGSALVALAVLQPSPVEPVPRETPIVERPIGLTNYTFCPQWRSDGAIESQLRGVAGANTRVQVSWWNGDSFSVALDADRVGTISSELRQGVVPVMLESTNPVAASVRSEGALGRSAAGCAGWPATTWIVGVGGSLEGETTTLILMNPFPQAATIDIQVYSEQGLEVVESLEGFSIPAGESREINLSELLRLRTHLVVVVHDPDGATLPALFTQRGGGAIGVAEGKPLSERWFFPAPPTGTTAEVVVVNPAAVPVTVDIDHFGAEGSTLSADQVSVDRRSSVVIPLPEGVAVQVRADGEVGAAMRAASPTRLGIMTGVQVPAVSWALPGASLGEELVGLHVINPGPSTATATYRFVGAGAVSDPSSFEVAPGATTYLEVRASGSRGMIIEADVPVVVAWSTVGEEGDLVLDGGVGR